MTIEQLRAVYEEQYPQISCSGWLTRDSERVVIERFLKKVEAALESAKLTTE